jgi:hypothetical protein
MATVPGRSQPAAAAAKRCSASIYMVYAIIADKP